MLLLCLPHTTIFAQFWYMQSTGLLAGVNVWVKRNFQLGIKCYPVNKAVLYMVLSQLATGLIVDVNTIG